MLRVGIIAEGPSDFLVLGAIIRSVRPEADILTVHPKQGITDLGQGWRGVRAWCRRYGPRLETFLTEIPSRRIHLLVIHADCSMADKLGLERPCPPPHDTANDLSRAIHEIWLGRGLKPGFVVVATPSMSSDAWVAAAFDPPHPNLAGIECDKAVEDEFVRRRLLRKRDGQVKKSGRAYEPLVNQMAGALDRVFAHCSRALAFRDEFEVAASSAYIGE